MAYGRTQADGLNLTDQALDAQGIRLGDVVVLADVLARAVTIARTLTDTVVLADARTFAQGEKLADTVALTDQLSRVLAIVRTLADTVTPRRRTGRTHAAGSSPTRSRSPTSSPVCRRRSARSPTR